MENHEMILMWINDALKEERKRRNSLAGAYDSLCNKQTIYAKGIKRCHDIRESIVKLWENAAAEYVEAANTSANTAKPPSAN